MRQRGSRRRFRPFFMLVVLGLLAAALMYLRCGDELGFGVGGRSGVTSRENDPGGGERKDEAEQKPEEQTGSDVRPAVGGGAAGGGRCMLRLDAGGLTLDGRPSTVDKAVTECKQAGGAELTVTGDAVFGDRKRIRQALERARVELFVREVSVPER